MNSIAPGGGGRIRTSGALADSPRFKRGALDLSATPPCFKRYTFWALSAMLCEVSKVVFISCVSKKLPHRAMAEELYVSDLFKKSLAYARTLAPKKIFILSAKYGLVPLDKVIEPYEQTLNTMRDRDVKDWAANVLMEMKKEKVDFKKDEAIFLAGAKYRKYLMPEFTHATAPLSKLGIGRQLAYLKHETERK